MSDLVIGARRATRRPLRTLAIGVLLVSVSALVAYLIYRRMVSYPHPDGELEARELQVSGEAVTFGESTLSRTGSLYVLRLVGKPHTLGAAHGRLVAEPFRAVATQLAPTIERTVPEGGFFAGLTRDMRLRWRYRLLDDGIPGHQLVELAGMLRGVEGSLGRAPAYESFVRQQAALDIGLPAAWSAGESEQAVTRGISFAVRARDQGGERLLIGRSFGLPGASDDGEAAAQAIVVSFVRADSVIPYASVGWPGLAGAVTGINAEGIAVMVHPARTRDVRTTRSAQPLALLARDVLENARTLDDAISIVEKAQPLGAATFLVADGNTRAFAVVDRTPSRAAVRRFPESPVVTETLLAKPFAEDPENDRARRSRPSAARAKRAGELLAADPPESAADVAAILRDQRSDGGRALPFGHRAAVEDLAAQHAVILDASAMVLWVSEGPGASGRFRAFDLRHELRREGARPAPPPDVEPSAVAAADRARAVVAAQADLRAARRARGDGDARRARELVARALARAPDLPPALLLGGELARASGDSARALELFRRYLDARGDDPAAAQEVEAVLRNQ